MNDGQEPTLNTSEICEKELFVATLGAPNFMYAEVTWTQQLEDWKRQQYKVDATVN